MTVICHCIVFNWFLSQRISFSVSQASKKLFLTHLGCKKVRLVPLRLLKPCLWHICKKKILLVPLKLLKIVLDPFRSQKSSLSISTSQATKILFWHICVTKNFFWYLGICFSESYATNSGQLLNFQLCFGPFKTG